MNNNIDIWESVVNEKIVEIEKLKKKIVDYRKIIDSYEREKCECVSCNQDYIKEINMLKRKNKFLEEDNERLKKWILNMENSTIWKSTEFMRKVIDRMK